jgi:hypothetical protein
MRSGRFSYFNKLPLDESEAPYEGRVLVNNPEANEGTPPTPDNRYAGSFFVFGVHGAHYGNVGYGEGRTSQLAHDPRRPHAATGEMVVTATDLQMQAMNASQDVTVSLVPVNVARMSEEDEIQDVVKFDHLSGRHKARVFASALGLDADDAEEVREALLSAALSREADPAEEDEFGKR